ncbi:MAG: TolC family protein [Magnetococcales bacterium]|nr:TolC family protein [Magnetococcales bacterium]MBF0438401.1 TolC family protein [Magnetococcales bacterium]
MKILFRFLLSVAGIALIAGCAITIPAITPDEQESLARQDQELLFKGQAALNGPLTLHEAMARAIQYNLDLRVKRLEEVLAKNEEEVIRLDMLPKMTMAAGYSSRSKDTSSVSQSLSSGMISTDPSISRETTTSSTDLTMSWNLLDFGVSYFYARQEGNKQLIQAEQRRKATHNLLKDVRLAFWKAASAEWLNREITVIMKASEQAAELSRKTEREQLRSPVYALQFQLGLMDIVRQMEKTRDELAIAKEELAVLINLPPGVPYQLVDDSVPLGGAWELSMSIEALERMALSSRPELRIEQYQARIEADETRKTIARLFPGLEFDVSKNYDSNSFLIYQHWAQAGARMSWNLLRTLTGSQPLNLSDSREKVIQMRRLVMHMAILSQIRIAFHEYRSARANLQSIITENETRKRLQDHTANRSTLGLDSQLAYVQTVASSALGHIKQYESYARYQSAVGRLYATLGLDPLGAKNPNQELPQLTRNLRENDEQWQKMIFQTSKPWPFLNAKSTEPFPLSVLLAEQPATKVKKTTPNTPTATVAKPPTPLPDASANTKKTASNTQTTTNGKPSFAVQVAVTNNKAGADALLVKLKAKGYPARIKQSLGANGQPVMRVLLGVYNTSKEAEKDRDRYQKQERQSGMIVKY